MSTKLPTLTIQQIAERTHKIIQDCLPAVEESSRCLVLNLQYANLSYWSGFFSNISSAIVGLAKFHSLPWEQRGAEDMLDALVLQYRTMQDEVKQSYKAQSDLTKNNDLGVYERECLAQLFQGAIDATTIVIHRLEANFPDLAGY